jgi:hypothetical protein
VSSDVLACCSCGPSTQLSSGVTSLFISSSFHLTPLAFGTQPTSLCLCLPTADIGTQHCRQIGAAHDRCMLRRPNAYPCLPLRGRHPSTVRQQREYVSLHIYVSFLSLLNKLDTLLVLESLRQRDMRRISTVTFVEHPSSTYLPSAQEFGVTWTARHINGANRASKMTLVCLVAAIVMECRRSGLDKCRTPHGCTRMVHQTAQWYVHYCPIAVICLSSLHSL